MYFNENDPFAAQWLRNLFPKATVDERDIRQVDAAALAGFRRCHFFGGIGGWEYALELAGWPRERSVWTGSCPCQPFSDAGKRQAEVDERHLWPAFLRLIAERRPAVVFGEQVASSLGREWLAGVRDDLEALEYEVGAADLCAASVGAPHRRQRLYWVAYARGAASERNAGAVLGTQAGERGARESDGGGVDGFGDGGGVRTAAVANPKGPRRGMVRATNKRAPDREGDAPADSGAGNTSRVGDAPSPGPQEQWSEYRPGGERCGGLVGLAVQAGVPQWNGPTVAVKCSDGWRRVSAEPEAFPLAAGVSKRMGKLRGAGNAIVPQVAAIFIQAFMEATTPGRSGAGGEIGR